jgi:hypothetical protein
MGLIFAGIGITVLVFLWGQPSGGFGAPPLFFRVFGSLIALAFVVVGGGSGLMILTGRRPPTRFGRSLLNRARRAARRREKPPSQSAYACPRCGAPLADGADVSPHGDVKCTYCNCWFNVHNEG